jgi:hypothetical protein
MKIQMTQEELEALKVVRLMLYRHAEMLENREISSKLLEISENLMILGIINIISNLGSSYCECEACKSRRSSNPLYETISNPI